MIPKHYKLVKEHEHHYEIHDERDGKRFSVAKKGITLPMHAKLAKIDQFSDGGEVKKDSASDQISASYDKASDPDKRKSAAEGMKKAFGFAGGGYIPEVLANSSQMPVEMPFNPDSLMGPVTTAPPVPLMQRVGQGIGGAVNQAFTDAAEVSGRVARPLVEGVSGLMSGLSGTDANATPLSMQGQEMNTGPNVVQGSPEMTGSAPGSQTAPQSNPFAQKPMDMNAAIEHAQNALTAGAQAEGKAGKDLSQYIHGTMETYNKMRSPQEIMDASKKSDEEFQKKILEKEIDPNKVWHNANAGQKIVASLGLIFGGMGAGMTGGPNYAYDTINKIIDRDIDAQKYEREKGFNLWKMNREATKNDMEATVLTRNQLLTSIQAKAQEYMHNAAGTQAAARIAPLMLQLEQQKAANRFKMAVIQQAGQGGMATIDPTHLVSDIQDEKMKEGAIKEIEGNKVLNQNIAHVTDVMHKLEDINKTANRMGMNAVQSKKQAEALTQPLAVELARTVAGAMSDNEIKAMQATIGSLWDDPKTAGVKLQNISNTLAQKRSPGTHFKAGTGMDLNNFSMTRVGAQEAQRPEVRTMNGVEYVKAPGGWRRAR